MTRVFPIPPSPATVRSIWSMVELQLEVNALGMIGHMAIDDRETVWTTLAVEVVIHQICFHLGIHWLTYFRRCIETTCAPDFRDNRKLLSRKNRIFSWKDICYLGNDVARTGKMGSFEPFSEIVSVPSQKINELVEKPLQPELNFYVNWQDVWLREYGHICVDCTIHCSCDFKGYGSRRSCLCSLQGLEKAQLYRRAPLFRARWSVYIHRYALTPTFSFSWLTSR